MKTISGNKHFGYGYAALFSLMFLPTLGCLQQTVNDPSIYPEYSAATAKRPPAKPVVPADPMRNVFFGDLHVHTGLSADAYTVGVKTTPEDAYTFARGGEIEHPFGYGIKLTRPMDFMAVTDHAEYLGLFKAVKPDIEINKIDLKQIIRSGDPLKITAEYLAIVIPLSIKNAYANMLGNFATSTALVSQAWQQVVDAAERNNAPGSFTTFIGFEWTSMPGSRNLHRNVIYKDNKVPAIPFSALDSENPADLWAELEKERVQGMTMFAIPHNGNLSGGLMYAEVDANGQPFTADYVATRMRNEPISEIMQVKGASETHPVLSPDDEFANFEIFDQILSAAMEFSEPKGGYVRDALRTGLAMQHAKGLNPYRFGFISSTDGHNSASPVEEGSYFGKLGIMDGSSGIRLGRTLLMPEDKNQGGKWSAMGFAAVWAEENTRESLYNAMLRKETYATSGPRITVRFFGGWGYQPSMLDAANFAELGYKGGVPMGGDLPARGWGLAPKFAVWAMKDPDGANLDRIQIVKLWVDSAGVSHEKVFDVVGSNGRAINPNTGKLPPVGNTVDVSVPSYTNTIGASQLKVLWQDPEFAGTQEAAYYARVIEIPTPRWTTFSAVQIGTTPRNPASIQERAITSAIWYQP